MREGEYPIIFLHGIGHVGLGWALVEVTPGPVDGVADDDLLAGDEGVATGGVEVELRQVLSRRRPRNLLEGAGVSGLVTNGGIEASFSGPELWDLINVELLEGLAGRGAPGVEEAW